MTEDNYTLHIWRDGRMIVETTLPITPTMAEHLEKVIEGIQEDFMNKRVVILNRGWALQYHDGPAPIFDVKTR